MSATTIYARHVLFDLDGTLFDTHGKKLAYPDARETVTTLTHVPGWVLTLLTVGLCGNQWNKLMTCDLHGCFKSVSIVSESEHKRRGIESLVALYPVASRRSVVVVGDRPDVEIKYGNELGCTTVRIMRGKHAQLLPLSKMEKAHHQIASLAELRAIVEKAE